VSETAGASDAADAEVAVELQPSSAVPLRRNSGFRMLWIGQVLSDASNDT
jgi:hypothetical protein